MNNLEKYLDQVIEQTPPVAYDLPPDEPEQEVKPNFLRGVTRRWYIVVLVVILVSVLGLPAVWLLVEPYYVVQGAVRVAPSEESILTGEAQGSTGTGYRDFVNTQAKILTSGNVLQRIADELKERNLSIFSGQPQTTVEKLKAKLSPPTGRVDAAIILKGLVASQTISAGHVSQSELVAVTMKHPNAYEAKQIVDAFLYHYRAMYGADSLQDENNRLRVLEDQKTALMSRIW